MPERQEWLTRLARLKNQQCMALSIVSPNKVASTVVEITCRIESAISVPSSQVIMLVLELSEELGTVDVLASASPQLRKKLVDWLIVAVSPAGSSHVDFSTASSICLVLDEIAQRDSLALDDSDGKFWTWAGQTLFDTSLAAHRLHRQTVAPALHAACGDFLGNSLVILSRRVLVQIIPTADISTLLKSAILLSPKNCLMVFCANLIACDALEDFDFDFCQERSAQLVQAGVVPYLLEGIELPREDGEIKLASENPGTQEQLVECNAMVFKACPLEGGLTALGF